MRGTWACCLLLILGSGCATPQGQSGHLWLFPGIEGNAFWLGSASRGLREGGLQQQFHYFDWKRPLSGLANLTEYEQNREKARTLAAEIAETVGSEPLDLIGYSGGGGMAIFVAEDLPPTVQLRRVVLVQAAISPTYDLGPVLRRAEVINLYCPSDRFTLGIGTQLFGTMDRTYVASAGKDGFHREVAVSDPALRTRLREIPWQARDILYGHIGNHLGMLGYYWNRVVVAPLLTDEATPQ